MRISDWSSDVCSSDLSTMESSTSLEMDIEPKTKVESIQEHIETVQVPEADIQLADSNLNTVDRKSVVTGKSVSVSVDLGGRCVIKKKKKKKRNRSSCEMIKQIEK